MCLHVLVAGPAAGCSYPVLSLVASRLFAGSELHSHLQSLLVEEG